MTIIAVRIIAMTNNTIDRYEFVFTMTFLLTGQRANCSRVQFALVSVMV